MTTVTRVISPGPKPEHDHEPDRSSRERSPSTTSLTSFNPELHTPRPYGRTFSPSASASGLKSATALDKYSAGPASFTVLPYQSPVDGCTRSRTSSSSESRLLGKPPLPSPSARTSSSRLQPAAASASPSTNMLGSPAAVGTTLNNGQNASTSLLPEASIPNISESLESVTTSRKRISRSASSNAAAVEELDTTSSWSSFNSCDVYGATSKEQLRVNQNGDGTALPSKKSRSLRSSLQSSLVLTHLFSAQLARGDHVIDYLLYEYIT